MYYIHLSLSLARSPSPILYTKQGGVARGTNLKFRGAASGAVEDAVCAANLRSVSWTTRMWQIEIWSLNHWVGLRVNLQETMVLAHPILGFEDFTYFQSSHEFALQQSNMECWEIPPFSLMMFPAHSLSLSSSGSSQLAMFEHTKK